MCISHVYKIQITYNVLISNLKRILPYDTCIYDTVARSFIFTAFCWPVNLKLYVRRSCYRLSKATRSAGKFAHTTELCSFIHLSSFGACP